MDEMQVKVVVRDIDDNSPVFLQHNTTTGVRVNAPLYTVIETLTAVDADVDSSAVFYQVGFLSLRGFSSYCHIYRNLLNSSPWNLIMKLQKVVQMNFTLEIGAYRQC